MQAPIPAPSTSIKRGMPGLYPCATHHRSRMLLPQHQPSSVLSAPATSNPFLSCSTPHLNTTPLPPLQALRHAHDQHAWLLPPPCAVQGSGQPVNTAFAGHSPHPLHQLPATASPACASLAASSISKQVPRRRVSEGLSVLFLVREIQARSQRKGLFNQPLFSCSFTHTAGPCSP